MLLTHGSFSIVSKAEINGVSIRAMNKSCGSNIKCESCDQSGTILPWKSLPQPNSVFIKPSAIFWVVRADAGLLVNSRICNAVFFLIHV